MKVTLGELQLFNRTTGRSEPSVLFNGIDLKNVGDVEKHWKPFFERRLQEIAATGETRSAINAEDAHWDWGRKALAALKDPLLFEMFVLECAGVTQAMMLVRKGGPKCFSKHPEHPGADLVYAEFLATAPWNRPLLADKPIYKGCGRTLVAAAVSLSLSEGLGGRMALHSLSGADSFYRDAIGMVDLGSDPDYHGLRYFELTQSQAASFFSDK